MKRLIAIVVMLAIAGIAFAQDVVEPATEKEGIALIKQQAAQLRLAWRDRTAATAALKEMVKARISAENAWRLVSGALDQGLKAREMKELATQVQLGAKQGLSPEECETAVQAMVREQVREREQTSSGATDKTQTQTQASTEVSAGSGTPAGPVGGQQTGKGD